MTVLRFDRKAFFDSVRGPLFQGSMTTGQVKGMERLLTVWEKHYSNLPMWELEYDLATSKHETGHTMQPIKERGGRSYFNRYDIRFNPKKAKELGNVNPGDGFLFRGEGDVQNTGRRNARVSSERLNKKFNLNVDFEKIPDKLGEPILSAHCLFSGNNEGWWTGKKLSDYDNHIDRRRVVNGTDRAALIAGYADKFGKALEVSARQVTPTEKVVFDMGDSFKKIVSMLGSKGGIGAGLVGLLTSLGMTAGGADPTVPLPDLLGGDVALKTLINSAVTAIAGSALAKGAVDPAAPTATAAQMSVDTPEAIKEAIDSIMSGEVAKEQNVVFSSILTEFMTTNEGEEGQSATTCLRTGALLQHLVSVGEADGREGKDASA